MGFYLHIAILHRKDEEVVDCMATANVESITQLGGSRKAICGLDVFLMLVKT